MSPNWFIFGSAAFQLAGAAYAGWGGAWVPAVAWALLGLANVAFAFMK